TDALPLVTAWTGAGSALVGCNQPAWAPSNNAGDFLPALMKANSCAAKDFGTDPHNGLANVMTGDIVVHTVDSVNGNPTLGLANLHFTVPAGDPSRYQITGSVWDAALDTSRPQGWILLVNGVQKAAGSLAGNVPRSQAQTFNITVNLAGGDTVDLELFKNGEFGYFVGTNMTLTPVCILTDAPSYNATTGILTMKFTVGTPSAATWNGWLTVGNTIATGDRAAGQCDEDSCLGQVWRGWYSVDADYADGRDHMLKLVNDFHGAVTLAVAGIL
ncbi:MAG: hypothetical protein ABSE40_15825, partial [Candidatus Sulfotelmatobacter sp.]